MLTYVWKTKKLTPWSEVHLKKLIVKFPAIYWIQKSITVFTRAYHCPEPNASSLLLSTLFI